jgi:hypothetical protein
MQNGKVDLHSPMQSNLPSVPQARVIDMEGGSHAVAPDTE